MKTFIAIVAALVLLLCSATTASINSETGNTASGRSGSGTLILDSVYGQAISGNAGRLTSGFFAQQNLPNFVAGDVDGSGSVTISDVVFLISYIFGGTEPPPNPASADADCSGMLTISDAVFLISYIFNGGSLPSYCS